MNPMAPVNRNAHNKKTEHSGRILNMLVFIGIMFGLSGATTAWAADAIEIERANWSNDRDRLTVRGKNAPNNATVTISYGKIEDNGAELGTTRADSDGDWRFRIPNPDPVPCDVTAQAGGNADDKNVRRAPNNCSNEGGTPPQPVVVCDIAVGPLALDFGSVNLGSSKTLSTTVSNNGDAACEVTLTVPTASDFAVEPATSFSVTPGGSQIVSVRYTPGELGEDSGNIAVNSNDPDTPSLNVVLTGNGVENVAVCVPVAEGVSINSSSQNGCPDQAVGQVDPVLNGGYRVLAINDLGMHCGDLDTRISSILPPFNVLHAQVVERGVNGLPRVMKEGEVELSYSATSNPDDPAIARANNNEVLSSMLPDGSVYKTNFWDIASQAYKPFYPAVYVDENGNPSITPTGTSKGILDLFYDPNDPTQNVDIGLPVPDVERLYLGDGTLHASQAAMPGINTPYVSNDPQPFHEHIGTLPFFVNFPFGYTADLNLFEAPGVPIAAFDDFGRENAYPLVRVEAHVNGNSVASLDTVMPISGEASCDSCHAAVADGGNGAAIGSLTETNVATAFGTPGNPDDPGDPQYGEVPLEISVEWASDKNILALHDQKHGTDLQNSTPVVCQTCHYTPALDLAQLGPLGPENDGELQLNNMLLSSTANGRDQVKHKSMSNVMHSHHGAVTDAKGNLLIPDMPPAIDDQGNRRDPALTRQVLEDSCYLCHPGKRTDCMRGAMANGGLVCQDCHGQMADVGDDFTKNVQPTLSEDGTKGPGKFQLGADFYTNPDTPRVPWANEPGCGSCHTGYATDNLAGTEGTLVNPTDNLGNADGIRLLSAYLANDPKATPIVPTNKAFAENVVAEGAAADGNPKLYRVSTGHGGVMCEGCHGSTHAEWPNGNDKANDNVAANQLQGHVGVLIECDTCHTNVNALSPDGTSNSLRGPHGMHAVGDTNFARGRHEEKLKEGQNKNACRDCHGQNGQGSVLSRMAADRVLECKETTAFCPDGKNAMFPKGHTVGCVECHKNGLFED